MGWLDGVSVARGEGLSTSRASFGHPVVIDGVEIVVSAPYVARLPKNSGRRSGVLAAPVLQFKVTLRNTDETKIVVLQSIWDRTLLIDEHDNRMAALGTELAMMFEIGDLWATRTPPTGTVRREDTAIPTADRRSDLLQDRGRPADREPGQAPHRGRVPRVVPQPHERSG